MTGYVIAIIVIVSLMAFSLALFWLITQISSHRYNSYIHDNLFTTRSIIIDYNNQEVKFFNHNSLRRLRKLNLARYLNQFSRRDSVRFTNWIDDLIKDNKITHDTLDADVRLNRVRRSYYSIFQVVNVDHKKKIIFLDNYLFYKLSQKGRVMCHAKSIDDIFSRIKFTITGRGYIANFKFSTNLRNAEKGDISHLLLTQLKDIAAGTFPLQQKIIIPTGKCEFCILDFRSSSQSDASNYLHRVISEMSKFLEVNSKLNEINIAVGLVYNSFSPNNPKKIIEKAKAMSQIAQNKNTLLITYAKNLKNELTEDKFQSEIEQVIKKKQIIYKFQAIYSVRKEKTVGYLSIPTPIDVGVKSMTELYVRSIRAGENAKLVQLIVKDGISAFRSKLTTPISNAILFHTLVFQEVDNFLATIKNLNKNIRQGIVFDEYDISYVSEKDKDKFFETVKKLKDSDITISMMLSDKTLYLDHKIYSLFDYFFVLPSGLIYKDDSNNLDLRVIIEKLIKYGKPIVLTDVDTWSAVELFIRSGVEYVASPAVIPITTHLEDISTKTKAKIKRMLQ